MYFNYQQSSHSVATPEGGAEPESASAPPPYLQWDVTKQDGAKEQVFSDGSVKEIESLLSYTATDPESREVMIRSILFGT